MARRRMRLEDHVYDTDEGPNEGAYDTIFQRAVAYYLARVEQLKNGAPGDPRARKALKIALREKHRCLQNS